MFYDLILHKVYTLPFNNFRLVRLLNISGKKVSYILTFMFYHLFDKKCSKNTNTVKYYYNLK